MLIMLGVYPNFGLQTFRGFFHGAPLLDGRTRSGPVFSPLICQVALLFSMITVRGHREKADVVERRAEF